MIDQMIPLVNTYAFNTEMISVGLSDLSQDDAYRQWKDGKGSSITYLVGHLASSRFGLLKGLGQEIENSHAVLFGAGAEPQGGADYPSVDQLRSDWQKTGEMIQAALTGLSEAEAQAESAGTYPTPDRSVLGAIAFILWHESYHVGQVGIMRTEMGYPELRSLLLEARKNEAS